MPMVDAFIKAVQERTDALAALVSVPPAAATFEMKNFYTVDEYREIKLNDLGI